MRALDLTGRQTEALRAYQEWRRHLADDLGLDPSPELQHLEHQILNHELAGAADTGTAWPSLPRPISTFIGRDTEVTTVAAALGEHRLVVLCGPGGVGKTRLALETARSVTNRYPNCIAFCDLTSVTRDADVVRVVAAVLGIEERSVRGLEDQLVNYLGHRRALLIIDNCEHVIDAAARLVDRIVQHTGSVTIVATTREPLAVAGEHLITVAPLATEGSAAAAPRLFLDRALRGVFPASTPLTSASRQSTTSVASSTGCPWRLSWPPRARAEHDAPGADGRSRPSLRAAVGARGPDERHRSLRAVLDWSYDLLSADERSVFDQLSVFASAFDLDAARAVVGDDFSSDEATAAVLRLVDCSLMGVIRGGEATQYALLDSMRSYGLERLRACAALDAARSRHAAWALGLAEAAANGLASPNEGEWASRVARHFAEFRAAHEWLVGQRSSRRVASRRGASPVRVVAACRRDRSLGRGVGVGSGRRERQGASRCAALRVHRRLATWRLRGGLALARTAAQAVVPLAAEDVRYVVDIEADVAFISGDVDTAVRLHRRAADMALSAGDLLQAMWALGSVSHALTYGAELEESHRVAEQTRLWRPTAAVPRLRRCTTGSSGSYSRAVIPQPPGRIWRRPSRQRHLWAVVRSPSRRSSASRSSKHSRETSTALSRTASRCSLRATRRARASCPATSCASLRC